MRRARRRAAPLGAAKGAKGAGDSGGVGDVMSCPELWLPLLGTNQ
jgi:hypothetical protein